MILKRDGFPSSSPLGKAILGAEEGDEVELPLENGRQRKVLIESVEKSPVVVAVSGAKKSCRRRGGARVTPAYENKMASRCRALD